MDQVSVFVRAVCAGCGDIYSVEGPPDMLEGLLHDARERSIGHVTGKRRSCAVRISSTVNYDEIANDG